MMKTVKIGCVDTLDSQGNKLPFGRVNLTDENKVRGWYYFKSLSEWNRFADLWMKLEKPWKLRYNGKGIWRPVKERDK